MFPIGAITKGREGKELAEIGSMHEGDWLVGYGCATAVYPTKVGASTARVRLTASGRVLVQTASHEMLPSENFGVLRLRRPVLNPFSYAGGMATSRIGANGSYNFAYGLDGLFRLRGDDYASLQWAQTFDHAVIEADDLEALNSGRLTVALERRRRQGFGYDSYLIWSGPYYDPGIGFVQRHDFTHLNNTVSYTWMPPEPSRWIWHTLLVNGLAYRRNGDGTIESAAVGPEWTFSTRSLTGGGVTATLHYEDLLLPFVLSAEAEVPAGSYTFYRAGASYQMPQTRLVQTGIRAEAGTFFDGRQVTLALTPRWYVSPHLELNGTYEYNRVRFPDRDQLVAWYAERTGEPVADLDYWMAFHAWRSACNCCSIMVNSFCCDDVGR